MNIDNFKLQTKALLPLTLMSFVVLCMVGFGSYKLSSISSRASHIIEHRDRAAATLARASRLVMKVTNDVLGTLVFDGSDLHGLDFAGDFSKSAAKAEQTFDETAGLIPDQAAQITAFKTRFLDIVDKGQKSLRNGEAIPGLEGETGLKPLENERASQGIALTKEVEAGTRGLIDDIVVLNNKLLAENSEAAADLRAQSTAALWTLICVGLVSVIGAGAFSVWLSSSKISKPLVRLAERMRVLAKGELSVEIDGQKRLDEIGTMAQAVQVFKANAIDQARLEKEAASARAMAEAERERAAAERARAAEEQAHAVSQLGDALQSLAAGNLTTRLGADFSQNYVQIRNDFNEAIDRLKATMLNVVSSAEVIQSGSQEISSASEDLSRRTEQQAASLEETAAALDEITATVKKSAEGALHAREVVAEADSDAKKSVIVVGRAVEAMAAITKSSQQISQIIGVIDEIAFQTNLLALNAGVEAARAGDAGRGFAVVASEVRALAQRSAEAAKEIKGLITSSTVEVENGVELVAETGKSLERIMAQVSEINGVIAEIAAGAREQATGLTQINSAINQMDQVTQQNAAMVEESTAASHSLSQETTQLSGLIGQFQVGPASDASMRNALKKAAPHAFRQPVAPPARKALEQRGTNVARAVHGGSEVNWEEF